MRSYLILIFLVATILSCNKVPEQNLEIDGQQVSAITMAYIDTPYYGITDASNLLTEGLMKQGASGLDFYDSLGKPSTKFYKTKEIDEDGRNEIKKLLSSISSAERVSKKCMPIYRDVLLFNDAKGNYLGHTNICFACNMVEFSSSLQSKFRDADQEKLIQAFRKIFSSQGIDR